MDGFRQARHLLELSSEGLVGDGLRIAPPEGGDGRITTVTATGPTAGACADVCSPGALLVLGKTAMRSACQYRSLVTASR